MAKTPKNNNKHWSKDDVARLRKLIKGNTPTGLMGYKLGRSDAAVQQKANNLGLSTKPVNKSPYNRRRK